MSRTKIDGEWVTVVQYLDDGRIIVEFDDGSHAVV